MDYCAIEWFALEMKRDHSVIFEIAQKAVYYHPAYLTYLQNMSCEMLGWMKHKLESRLPGEILITTLMAESEEEVKSLLMNVKEERGKLA